MAKWILVLLPAVFVVWLLWPTPSSPELAQDSVGIKEVVTSIEIAPVEHIDLPLYAEATGYLEPWRKVEVKTETSGRVVHRGVKDGQRVAEGAALVRLFDRDQQIELAEAKAELLRVQANYAVFVEAESDRQPSKDSALDRCEDNPDGCSGFEAIAARADAEIQRTESLFTQGLVPETAVHDARRRLDSARMLTGERQTEVRAATTGLTQAELRLERAELALSRTIVSAPFSGRVADVAVEVGQQLGTSESCLLLLD